MPSFSQPTSAISHAAASNIALNQRIIQANTRLIWICRQWYVGKMPSEDYQAERKQILDFIDEQCRIQDSDIVLDDELQNLVKPKPKT